jgi:hypothetical protein
MAVLNRRDILIGAAALAAAGRLGTAGSAAGAEAPSVEIFPGNPHGARATAYTIVTADMGASLAFYRDAWGYDHVVEGKLGKHAPTVAGAGGPGRRFAVLNFKTQPDYSIRLLEAPAGAAANRPPGTTLLEPGLLAITGRTHDYRESFPRLVKAGMKPTAEPGSEVHGAREWVSYGGIGPSGEQLFVSCFLKDDGKNPAWNNPPYLHAPFFLASVLSFDRWPLLDFYGKVFETIPTKESNVEDPPLVKLMGLPPDAFLRFANTGDKTGIEWWENRQRRPPGNIHPTALDRTGIAMITLTVNDLAATRMRAEASGYPVIGEGSLPIVGAEFTPGFYLRGSQGELIEVVGRT